jgi:chromosome segregation ATPase
MSEGVKEILAHLTKCDDRLTTLEGRSAEKEGLNESLEDRPAEHGVLAEKIAALEKKTGEAVDGISYDLKKAVARLDGLDRQVGSASSSAESSGVTKKIDAQVEGLRKRSDGIEGSSKERDAALEKSLDALQHDASDTHDRLNDNDTSLLDLSGRMNLIEARMVNAENEIATSSKRYENDLRAVKRSITDSKSLGSGGRCLGIFIVHRRGDP